MLIEHLLNKRYLVHLKSQDLKAITTHCSQFLSESKGLPLLKLLPTTYSDFHKVKVRLHKKYDIIAEAYDKAFGDRCANIRQRAIFAYGSQLNITEHNESFYVFPIDGYHFMYSREVKNSNNDYKRVIDTLFEQFENPAKASEIVTDLLKYTYSTTHLNEGIASQSEIIVYGIPYYYAIKVSAVPNYSTLLTNITIK